MTGSHEMFIGRVEKVHANSDFVDESGNWVLGDEVLTPESSRFIALEDFEKGNFISMDKQILRDFGKKENWKEILKILKIIII